MTLMQITKPAAALAGLTFLTLCWMSTLSTRAHADSSSSDSRVQLGFSLSPVKLDLAGKNPALVGKGSFIVNAQSDCNGCHNSPLLGGEWAPNHNPSFGQSKVVNANGFLAGGTPFGPFPGTGKFIPAGSPPGLYVYSRNLTPGCETAPCSNPLPAGGMSFQDFLTVFRTGHDFDNAHPACPNMGVLGCILSPPFDPSVLEVMPWPVFGNMTDDDIAAIYEYLKAVPCISNQGLPVPSNLIHVCPK